MRIHAKESNVPSGTWIPPLVGVLGTVAGILFAFARIDTGSEWTTALQAVGFSLAVTVAILIVLSVVVAVRRRR
jgi:biopolymer transport protein ExbB/TolQ